MLHQQIQTVKVHIIDNGFNQFYKKWIFHGEVDSSVPSVVPKVLVEADTVEDEMVDVIYDFIGLPNYPSSNDVEVEDDAVIGPTMSTQYYDELFSEVEVELYPRFTDFSSLNFLVKLIHLKVLHKWINKSFDSLLKRLKDAFPNENKILGSHYDTKKWMEKLGLGYESYSCL